MFFQRKHTDSWEEHGMEKKKKEHGMTLNITNYQQNANQKSTVRSPPHTCQNGCYQKSRYSKCCEYVEKRKLLCSAGGTKWCNHYENMKVVLKLVRTNIHHKIEHFHFWRIQRLNKKYICSPCSLQHYLHSYCDMEAHKCLSVDEWIKMVYVCVCVCVCVMGYYSAMYEILSFSQHE